MVNKIRKNKKDIISGVLAVVVLLLLVFYGSNLGKVFGATFSWSQSSWTGGADTNDTADHSVLADRTDWNKYYSASSTISAGANITLSATAASTTQTSDADFNSGATSTTAVSNNSVILALNPQSATITQTDNTSNIATPSQQGGWAYGTFSTTVQNGTTGTGASVQLTTSPCGSVTSITDSRDTTDPTYNTVEIGTQCWLKRNENVGTKIAGVSSQTNNAILEKYCYSDTEANCSTDGGLYQWDEAMQYVTTEGAQGICPTGWHIPRDSEQYTLENYLKIAGQTCNAARSDAWDCNDAGTDMKSSGSPYFYAPLAGFRKPDGSFSDRAMTAVLWSSTQYNTSNAWNRALISSNATVYRNYYWYGAKVNGFSIRCLKDTSSYASSGTYTSYIDGGTSAGSRTWNYFNFTKSTSSGGSGTTQIRMQVKSSDSSATPPTFDATGNCDVTVTADATTSNYDISTCAGTGRYLWHKSTLTASADGSRSPLLDQLQANITNNNYYSSGTYTSASIDLGQKSDLTTLGFSKTVPIQAGTFQNKEKETVSAGSGHTCYLLSTGNSQCYGNNDYGQSTAYTGGNAVAVSAGDYHTCYLLSTGNSQCYGYNYVGQSTAYTGGNAVAVSAGGDYSGHTCYLLSTGNSQCYGSNSNGQSTAYTGGNAVGVSAGTIHTCYLLSNGNSQCYGDNGYGQTTAYTGGNAIAVSAGYVHTCYLKSTGNSQCYGAGGGRETAYTGGNAIAVSAGGYVSAGHTCYLLSTGNSQCYGNNNVGQSTAYTGGNAVAVSAGQRHTCYLLSTGNSQCYGSNSNGQSTAYTGGNALIYKPLKLQIAANNDNATWNYVGPDGTANSYYYFTGAAIPSSLDGNRYLKYKLYFSTTDIAYTPSLDDITINYSYYGSGSLTSSKYDTSSDANVMGGIAWDENATLPSDTTVTVSLKTADSAANLDTASWTDFTNATTGCTKASGTVTCSASAIPSAMKDGNGDQWVQYKITLTSTGANTPTVDNINVTYVVNAPPQFDATFGTNGVSVSQISDSGDANWGKVKIQYAIRDTDADSGTITPNYITPSFEYNIGAGWQAIDSQYLAAGDTSNKAVATSTYTTYTAYWDARTHISGTYYAATQIRVTANDNEAANNTTTAMGANFALDVKNVAIAAFTLDSSTDTIALNLSDDNNLEYKISNNADFAGSDWQAVGGTSTSTTFAWTFSGAPSFETVYLTTKDTLGNTATTSATAPSTPQNLMLYDISNPAIDSYSELMSWEVYTASSTAAFSNYKIYRSTNGADYSLLTTISNINTNSYTDSTVASTTTYYYKVRVTDTDGDISSYSASQNDLPDGQGGSDYTTPTISAVTVAENQATWARITWTTDELSDSKVEYSTAAAGNYSSNASSTAYVTSHSITITGLTPATDYIFRVKSKDLFTNEGSAAGTPFTTASGPAITDVVTSSVNDNSAEITWNTNNDSNSYVIYSTNTSSLTADSGVSTAGSGTAVGGSGPLYYHKVTLPNLLSRTTYYYYVKSIDASDNIVTDKNSSNYYSFTTTYDTKAPVISNISTPVRTADTMIIFWNTDELANSQVDFGLENGVYTNSGTLDSTLTVSHALTLSSLTAETTYHYRIRSADSQGNIGYSANQTASTTSARDVVIQYVGGGGSVAASDTTPPSVSNIKTSAINAFDATVSFDTNELATGYVLYGKDETYGNIASSIDFKTSGHSVKLPGLVLGTEYHYKVKAQDKFGNFGDSGDMTFTTKFATETLDNLVTLENAESFQNQLEGIIESIMPSLSPPFISKIEVSDVTENSAIVRWVTNVKAYGSAAYVADNEYESKNANPYKSEISDTQEKSKSHEVNLANLSPSTKYHLQAKSYAIPGVVGKSKDVEFTTKSSKIAPEVVKVGNTQIEIRWTTSSETSSFVEFKNRATGQTGQKGDSAMAKVHSVVLDNLNPATSYEIKAFGYDANNNIVEGNAMTIKTKQDVIAPELSSIKIDNALVPGRTDRLQTIIFWKTNEPANSVVYYEEGISNVEDLANKAGEEKEYTTDHAVIIANFKPSTIYRIKIVSEDEAGNKTSSPIRAILTPRSAESIVDVIFKNFQESFGFLKKLQR